MTDEHPSADTPSTAAVLVEESAVHHHAHAEAGDHGAHPKDAEYILIALILAAITAVEVGISYIKGLGDAAAPMLLILAGIKFVMVVMFFMHLRFDNHVFRRFFITGMVLAVSIYVAVFLALGVFSSTHGAHG